MGNWNDKPELINQDAEGAAWILKIKLADKSELDKLMNGTPSRIREIGGLMRYLPHTEADRRAMLGAIGVAGIEALFADVPPSKLRSHF